MGSSIEDNCVVESYAVIAAGAVLPRNSKVPSGQIWAGNPAKYLRDVTPEERDSIREHHSEVKNLAAIHSEENEKTFEEIFEDEYAKERSYSLTETEAFNEKLETIGYSADPIDITEIERIKEGEYGENRYNIANAYEPKSWKPFKEDASVFPQDWKIYGEDMESYERAKKIFDQPPKARDESTIPAIPRDQTPWTRRY
jgi:hypothetical protein